MKRKRNKRSARRETKPKLRQRAEEKSLFNEFRVAARRALSSGWVQNSSIAFILVTIALGVSMFMSTGVKSAAITFAVVGTICVWIIAILVIHSYSSETEYSGLLIPADEPTPPNPCRNVPAGATLVLLGNSASYGTSFPQTIIQIRSDKMLVMDKIKGQIAVSALLYSEDGRIVAQIKNNEFFINPNNYFRKERPDLHTLIVYDQNGTEVLNVRFINDTTIRFSGVIRHPTRTVLVSDKAGLFANTICTGEAGVAHFSFQ